MNRFLPIALLAVLGANGAALAQPQAQAPAGAPAAASPAWRSTLDGYRPFSDEKTVPWREANDTVREIGGWRAYAREAAQPASGAASGPKPGSPRRTP